MRGVSTPTHEYSRVAAMHVHSLTIHPNNRDPSLAETVQSLTAATRAYTRVLLRLRAQAEKEASIQQSQPPSAPATPSVPPPMNGRGSNGNFSPARPAGSASRVSSRAPSPTTSSNSHYYHNAGAMNSNVNINTAVQASSSQTNLTFRSPCSDSVVHRFCACSCLPQGVIGFRIGVSSSARQSVSGRGFYTF
jgi:hypothetical protein